MKKKFLSLLLCASLVLSICPQIVLAENVQDNGMACICETKCTESSVNTDCLICGAEELDLELCKGTENDEDLEQNNILTVSPRSEGIVAKVGNNDFSSLADAVAAITSTSDKTGTVEIVADIQLSEFITIPDGSNIKLVDDGVMHTITMVSDKEQYSYAAFVIEQGGSLTIDGKNLTFTRQTYGEPVSGLVACHGEFTLENGTFDFNGQTVAWNTNTNCANAVIHVCGASAIFTMNGGTIQNASLNTNTGGVQVSSDAKFILNDGMIQKIDVGGVHTKTGAVLVYAPDTTYNFGTGTAYFEMNGGTIQDNTGYRGAGINVVGQTFNYRATMLLNGGTIQRNTCTSPDPTHQAAGGGIYIEGNAEVTMNGGNILNNTVDSGTGGGVCAVDGYTKSFPDPNAPNAWPIEQYSYYFPAAFTMNGGTISGNCSLMGSVGGDGGCGGGIYCASNKVTLKGGYIENNEAERQGGGVYIGSIPYELTIYEAVVTGNEASILGGGVWACPTGNTEVFVTNGVGIYNNKSNGAGDDVVSVKIEGKNNVLTLADRILGGGQVLWYKDGGITDNENNLGNPDSSPRYAPGGDVKPITQIQNSTEPYALKAVVSDEAKELAEDSAMLFIRGNKSARGGGIGTNGGIIMGEKDNEYTLKVTKDWGDTDDSMKTPITVFLKVGETVLDPVTLDAENSWTAEFSQLPDPATLAEGVSYAVVESPVPEHFKPGYSEAVIDEDTRTITIDITNTYQPNGSLTVSKTVSGSAADETKEFSFTVTLDDISITGKYGDMKFADGVASFTLKHEESKTATNLPAGISYIVVESDNDGYTVTSTGAAGTITDRQMAEAKFNNHKDKSVDPTEPEKPDKPSKPGDFPTDPEGPSSRPEEPSKDNTGTKTPDSPQTGDDSNITRWFAVLLMAGFGLTGTILYSRKKKYNR